MKVLTEEDIMKVEISNFGKAKDGSDLKLYNIINENGMKFKL